MPSRGSVRAWFQHQPVEALKAYTYTWYPTQSSFGPPFALFGDVGSFLTKVVGLPGASDDAGWGKGKEGWQAYYRHALHESNAIV